MPNTFKPVRPPSGRDWLAAGLRLCACTCSRCNPKNDVTTNVGDSGDEPSTPEAEAVPSITLERVCQ
jgi:hypothetical protein